MGDCQDSNGSWNGTNPRWLSRSEHNSAVCLRTCKNVQNSTGCTHNPLYGGCIVHTGDVVKGDGKTYTRCWKFASLD